MAQFVVHKTIARDHFHSARKPLIGLTGRAGSGKDTAGEAVLGWFMSEINHDSFARPLKEMLAKLLHVPVEKMEDREWRLTKLEGIGRTPRELMQTLGTEWGRRLVHPDLWVNMALRGWDDVHVGGSLFTDVRFDNEAISIKERGGVIIRLVKDGEEELRGAEAAHASEAGIRNLYVDATVKAEFGDIDGLQSMTLAALGALRCTPQHLD